jgi:hypothetical protein
MRLLRLDGRHHLIDSRHDVGHTVVLQLVVHHRHCHRVATLARVADLALVDGTVGIVVAWVGCSRSCA